MTFGLRPYLPVPDRHRLEQPGLSLPDNDEFQARVLDSVETAFFEGEGECTVLIVQGDTLEKHSFNDRFERDGMSFIEPSPDLFTFNRPVGPAGPLYERETRWLDLDGPRRE